MPIARPQPPAAARATAGTREVSGGAADPLSDAGTSDALAAALSAGVFRGESAALDALYRAWFDRAYATARRLTGRDESFCLDAVQDAMVRVIKGIRPLPDEASLSRWMIATVRSACLDALRREARRRTREHRRGGPGTVEDNGARETAARELDEVLARIEMLDTPDQNLLRLRFGGDRTLADAASACDMSGPAAHGRIRRTLARIGRGLGMGGGKDQGKDRKR